MLIYLDEAHTRGIDLPIPVNTHAAVTLGPRLVKDRLVQACMRMRKMGVGHSLSFFAPPEVHQSILELFQLPADPAVSTTSFHVLAWCMEQTCQALEFAQPLRIMQGLQWLRRRRLFKKYFPLNVSVQECLKDAEIVRKFWTRLEESEAQTLEQLYGAEVRTSSALTRLLDRSSSNKHMRYLVSEWDLLSHNLTREALLDEEQEREVAHEVETERQVQRPSTFEARIPSVSMEARSFVSCGTFESNAHSAFLVYGGTSAAPLAKQLAVGPNVFNVHATSDFHYCVKIPSCASDDYLRPVRWVLRSLSTNELLIISPHEANELLPKILSSKEIRLHVYEPRVVRTMQNFDKLDYFTLKARRTDLEPAASSLRSLCLFAGSLYSSSMADFEALCDFLGIVTPARKPDGDDIQIDSDGFAGPEARKALNWPSGCPFTCSPLQFLKSILLLRLRGQEIGHTHLGSLVNARAVRARDLAEGGRIQPVEEGSKGPDGDPMDLS